MCADISPVFYLLLASDIRAVLANRWQNFAAHPVLECAGLGFVRAHDELVEARLGDEFGVTQPLTPQLVVG